MIFLVCNCNDTLVRRCPWCRLGSAGRFTTLLVGLLMAASLMVGVACQRTSESEITRYNRIFHQYHDNFNGSTRQQIDKAVQDMLLLAEKENSHYGKALAHLDKAFFAAQSGRLEEMYIELEIARASIDANDPPFLIGYAYYVEGVVNYNTAGSIGALQSYNKAIKYFEELNDSDMLTRTYLNKYSYYIVKGALDQAGESLEKANRWCSPTYRDITTLYQTILNGYALQPTERLAGYQEWLTQLHDFDSPMLQVSSSNIIYWIYFYNNYLAAMVECGMLDSADRCCDHVIVLAQEHGSDFEQQMALSNKAWMHQLHHRYDDAIQLCEQINQNFKGIYTLGLKKSCYRREVDCYLAQNNYREAFRCIQQLDSLEHASVPDLKLSEEFLDNQQAYEQKISLLEQRHARYRMLLIIAVFVLVIIVGTFIIYGLKKRIREQEELMRQIENERQMLAQQQELDRVTMEQVTTREQMASVSLQLKTLASEMPKNMRSRLIESLSPLQDNQNKWTWKEFEKSFDQQYTNYVTTLTQRYPELNPLELKICMLIKAGLNNKEVATTLHLADNTVRTYRTRIRKKMHLNESQDTLNEALNNIQ